MATIPYWYKFGTDPVSGFALLSNLYLPAEASPNPAVLAEDPFDGYFDRGGGCHPRGAVLTHANLLAANLQTMACMGLTEHDTNLLALPLFHVAALNAALAVMHAGGANVLMARFDAEDAVRLIDAHQVTYVTSLSPCPEQYARRRRTGAEQAAQPEACCWPGRPRYYQAFAQHDIGTILDRIRADGDQWLRDPAARGGSSGQRGQGGAAVPGQTRRRLRPGRPRWHPGGNRRARSSGLPGILGQPDVTAYTFRGGWHHTGDVGRFDDEGYLYYVKRKPKGAHQARWRERLSGRSGIGHYATRGA